ncbi:MAG: protein kinase [Planctomycetes bacterium]|nr:protein kinase [Planctomycetota bacterium]
MSSDSEFLSAEDELLMIEIADELSSAAENGEKPAPLNPTTRPQIEGYHFERLLGRGGMGEVWLVRPDQTDTWQALKCLPSGFSKDERRLLRFVREAELASSLDHPALIPALTVEAKAKIPYFTMPFVDGRDLRWWLHRSRIFSSTADLPNERQWVSWLMTIADGLSYAHENGVIHRDVKPSNIIISKDNQPCLGDFGCAALAEPNVQLTAVGDMPGTPLYMAPELILGQVTLADPRCDVYGVGAVLYEALTGRPPYSGRTRAELARSMRRSRPKSPRRLIPGLSRLLSAIVMRAIAIETVDRYSAAKSLAQDLKRYLAGEHFIVPRPSLMVRLLRVVRYYPRYAALSLLGSLLVIALVTMTLLQASRERARLLDNVEASSAFLGKAKVALAEGDLDEFEIFEKHGMMELLRSYSKSPHSKIVHAGMSEAASWYAETGRWRAASALSAIFDAGSPALSQPRLLVDELPRLPGVELAQACAIRTPHSAQWVTALQAVVFMSPDGSLYQFSSDTEQWLSCAAPRINDIHLYDRVLTRDSALRFCVLTHRILGGKSWLAASTGLQLFLLEIEGQEFHEIAQWRSVAEPVFAWSGQLGLGRGLSETAPPIVGRASEGNFYIKADAKHRVDSLYFVGRELPLDLNESDFVSTGPIFLPRADGSLQEDAIIARAEHGGMELAVYRNGRLYRRAYAGNTAALGLWNRNKGQFVFASLATRDHSVSGSLEGSQLPGGIYVADWDGTHFAIHFDLTDRRFRMKSSAPDAEERPDRLLSIAPKPLLCGRVSSGIDLGHSGSSIRQGFAASVTFQDGPALVLYGPFEAGARLDLSGSRRLLRFANDVRGASIQDVADYDHDGFSDLLLRIDKPSQLPTLGWVNGRALWPEQ